MRKRLLAGACLAMLSFEAHAQSPAAQPAPAPGAQPSAGTNEVIVTATRRPENILDVPIAITNISSQQLERAGVVDVKRLVDLEPSLNVTTSVGEDYGAVIRIRGVGTSGSNPGLESATGVYIDGVYRNRAGLAINDLPGVDRIEVLRGPQGTLFGKNTTAGVVNILTKAPSFKPETEAEVSFGNYSSIDAKASVTGPIVADKLAGRFDALVVERAGTISDYVNGQDYFNRNRYQLRGQLLYTPTPDLSFRLIADYTKKDEGGGNAIPFRTAVNSGPTSAVQVSADLGSVITPHFNAGDTDREVSMTKANYFDHIEEDGLSLEGRWKIGPGELTSVTADRLWRSARSYDVDGNKLDLLEDPRDGEHFQTFSQELRYQATYGPLDYLFGAYYAEERILSRDSYSYGEDFEPFIRGLLGGLSLSSFTGLPDGSIFPAGDGVFDVSRQHTHSLSLFTHDIWHLTDRLTLTAGFRFTHELKELNADYRSNNPACAGAIQKYGSTLAGVPVGLQGILCIPNLDPRLDGEYFASATENEPTGTVAVDYKLARRLNTYVSYSRGYKAGGYSFDRSALALPDPTGSQLHFNPEFANAYEAGLKGVFLDGALRANSALFYTQFLDYQYTYNAVLASGVPQRVTTNLPELVSQGIEVETAYSPVRPLTFNLNATYENVKFRGDDFPTALVQLRNSTAPNAPRLTLTASGTYQAPLPWYELSGFIYLGARYQSDANVSSSGDVTSDFIQKGYATADARVGVNAPGDRWSVEFWARNLFDKTAWTQLVPATLQAGAIYGYLNDPRFYGITVRGRW